MRQANMETVTVTITDKGQITIPKEMMQHFFAN